MIVGIFGAWDFNFLEKPEQTFARKMDENPIYPFHEISHGIFVLESRSARMWLSLVCIFVSIIACVSTYATSQLDQYFPFLLAPIFFASYSAYCYNGWRRFVLNPEGGEYEFHSREKLIYRGHIHNVYIRLKGQKSANGELFLNIVFDGFNCEQQTLTSATMNVSKLRKLGRRLAQRLQINYFDYDDQSRHHVIRHKCPYDF